MEIDGDYRIWEATPQRDDTRPVLNHVLIERVDDALGTCGLAIAADGYMLACIPVRLAPEDVPGLVHAEAFVQARKATGKGLPLVMALGVDTVQFPSGRGMVSYPRFSVMRSETQDVPGQEPRTRVVNVIKNECPGDYPDWRRIAPLAQPEPTLTGVFTLDPARYARLCLILGVDISNRCCYLSAASPVDAFLVETDRSRSLSQPTLPVAPFGVIMPCRRRTGRTAGNKPATHAAKSG